MFFSMINIVRVSIYQRKGDHVAIEQGITADKSNARASAVNNQTEERNNAQNFPQSDWRVRLALAPGTNFLYGNGIMKPLNSKDGTDGVIFPYTPNINITYAANYDYTEPTHSNYKIYQYKNSSVDQINITCDFTAQDTKEADYLLAVIHFFRTVTKMFYGQVTSLIPSGTPPPLCFLHGLGAFQFDKHPLVITNFNYILPTDVDYIRAKVPVLGNGVNGPSGGDSPSNENNINIFQLAGSVLRGLAANRLGSLILPGGVAPPPVFSPPPAGTSEEATYVPTKIQLQITAVPIITRNDVSKNFSLQEYATGELLRGSNRNGGGMW